MTLEYDKARDMLSIEADDLEGEFIRAPDVLAFFNEQYAIAERAHLHAKLVYEQAKARAMIAVREKLTRKAKAEFIRDRQIEDSNVAQAKKAGQSYKRVDVKLKLPTAGEVEAVVVLDEDYTAARIAYIDAECEAKRLKGWCDVGRVKRDMLTNLGMRINAELRGAGWTPGRSHDPTRITPPPKKPLLAPEDPPF